MFFSNYKSQTLCPFSNGSCGRVKKHYQVKTVLRYTKTKKQGHYANLSPGPSCPSPEWAEDKLGRTRGWDHRRIWKDQPVEKLTLVARRRRVDSSTASLKNKIMEDQNYFEKKILKRMNKWKGTRTVSGTLFAWVWNGLGADQRCRAHDNL